MLFCTVIGVLKVTFGFSPSLPVAVMPEIWSILTVCLEESEESLSDLEESEPLEQPASVAHMASAHPAARAERSNMVILCECMTTHSSREP